MDAKNNGGRKRRKRLTAEKKFDIFLETTKADTAIGEVLRREGIYPSDLSRYRALIKEGALESLKSSIKRGPSEEERKILQLEEELRKRDEVIAQLSMERMILAKKVNGE
jgi:transposase-like protein